MQPTHIKKMIETNLPGAQAQVMGDGSHFEAIVVYEGFSGNSPVKRHQMVYSTLGNSMQSDIHALSLKTYTPREWAVTQK
jgi:acid stress-induced BolA-like protein IbaG/YrbA